MVNEDAPDGLEADVVKKGGKNKADPDMEARKRKTKNSGYEIVHILRML